MIGGMMHVPVFAGLGSPAIFSNDTRMTALKDLRRVDAQILLQACHKVFLREFGSLSADELQVGVKLENFQKPIDLLNFDAQYHRNAVFQSTTLYLVQLLRYLAVDSPSASNCRPASLGIAGFCSGLLSAVVVASSTDLPSFLLHAEEGFAVALWIGIRSEQFKQRQGHPKKAGENLPWALVVNGIELREVERLVATQTNKDGPECAIYIAAKTSQSCVTLGGRGDYLNAFCSKVLPPHCRIIPTCLYTLFHAGSVLEPVKQQVLQDVSRRCLTFPGFSDMKQFLYSTLDGKAIRQPKDTGTDNLLEAILEMMLIHPVDWIAVQDQLVADIESFISSPGISVKIINFGPGYGISKAFHPSLAQLEIIDACTSLGSSRYATDASPVIEDGIAIVGMAVDLPGASNTSELWKILSEGINTVTDIPSSRFHVEDYKQHEYNTTRPSRSLNTRFGNFMKSPFSFDHTFFGISPREAKSMDPQQRVLLQTAYHALEDAGFVPNASPSFAEDSFGCYVGAATLDYTDNLRDEIDVYYSTGTLRAFLSGRISYAFKFSGPSLTLDTACSSSTVALHQACRALLSGDCRAAIAGGVNVVTSPDMYLGLDRAHFLSPTGQCKAFDASADGYSRSEGCGIFVLKKLSDALAENDQILGVIRGIEVNQSGKSHSITHPHHQTQTQLFDRLLTKSKIDHHQVSVVEAHGTGTQAGDPNECESIRNVFCKDRTTHNPLHITSIKANIGHCEAASGAAGLAKLILMLQNDAIPRQISLKTLNPKISPLGVDGATITQNHIPWPRHNASPRIALLNNFGAAGSNAALLLQEHVPYSNNRFKRPQGSPSHVFGCSAKTTEALSELRLKLLAYFKSNKQRLLLQDVCYTSTARRQLYDHRISVSASSIEELIESLDSAALVNIRGIHLKPATVFVFSGQGSQYMGMGKDLYHNLPIFRETVLQCHRILLNLGFPGVLPIIDCLDDCSMEAGLRREATQASMFVLQIGLARSWISWGLHPTAVIGHSLGEYAALVIAGVIDLIDALKLVAHRARLMTELCESGTTGMLAVNASAATVRPVIGSLPEFNTLTITCYNSPRDCVIGGPLQSLRALHNRLKNQMSCKATLLDVPLAYHSEALDPILGPLTDIAKQVKLSPPTIPIVSNVLGRTVARGECFFTANYFAQHCREAVAFEQGLDDLTSNHLGPLGMTPKWVEIGPHPSSLPMIKAKLGSVVSDCIPSMRKKINPWTTLSQALSSLYMTHLRIDWRKVFDSFPGCCVSLPSYPFSSEIFYTEYPREHTRSALVTNPSPPSSSTGYAFLSTRIQMPTSDDESLAIFETPVEVLARSINGHVVCGYPLCPASVYHELVLAATAVLKRDSTQSPSLVMLSNITYTHPLLYETETRQIVKTVIKKGDTPEGLKEFLIYSNNESNPGRELLHCRGFIKPCAPARETLKFARFESQVQRGKELIFRPTDGVTPQTFYTKTLYDTIFTRVVSYSDMYKTILSITVDSNATQAYATVRLPLGEDCERQEFAANPIFMDTMLHAAGFVANFSARNDTACICKSLKSARVLYDKINLSETFGIFCSNLNLESEGIVLADAYATNSQGRIVAVFKGMEFTCIKLHKLDTLLRLSSQADPKRAVEEPQTLHKKGYTAVERVMPSARLAPLSVTVTSTKSTPSPLDTHSPVTAVIAETCGITADTISEDMQLGALGVDSLMFFELESHLKARNPRAQFSSSSLETCQTVGDVERLMNSSLETTVISEPQSFHNATTPGSQGMSDKVSTATFSQTEETISQESEDGYTLSESSPATSPGSSTPASDELSNSMENEIARCLRMDEYPTLIQKYDTSDADVSAFPLFLIHDGSGICTKYHKLESLQRSTWAIHNPNFLTGEPWESLDTMAQAYTDCITATTEGPYIVGGWSYGGVVAFEVARKLVERGHPVAGVILIDAPAPINHQPITSAIVDRVLNTGTTETGLSGKVRDLVRKQFLMNASALEAFRPGVTDYNPRMIMLRSSEGYDLSDIATPSNPWLEDRSDAQAAVHGWESIVRARVPVVDIPGNHFEPFQARNIRHTSRAIAEACAEMQRVFQR